MTRNVRFSIALALTLSLDLVSSACAAGKPRRPALPERAFCKVGEAGCVCFDPRRPKGEQEFVVPSHVPPCLGSEVFFQDDWLTRFDWEVRNCWGPRGPK